MSHPARWLLRAGRPASRWLIRRRYDVRLHHAERFPASGPVVVTANHISVIDGPVMAIFAPRPVHALTKQEMFSGPLGTFLRLAGQIPLDRFHPDPLAIRTALRVLEAGGAVGVFPEGARGAGELEVFQPGATYLAMVTGAPVVPLTFLGSREAGASSSSLPPGGARIDVVVGRPFTTERRAWPRTREEIGRVNALLARHMRDDLRTALDETGRSLPGPLPTKDSDD